MFEKLTTGIVLDNDLSRSFKVQAFLEGELKPFHFNTSSRRHVEGLHPLIEHYFLENRTKQKELAFMAYSSIVLFNKVYIRTAMEGWEENYNPSPENSIEHIGGGSYLDYNNLTKEGIVNFIEYDRVGEIFYEPASAFSAVDPDDFLEKKDLIINNLIYRKKLYGKRCYSKRSYEAAHKLLYKKQVYGYETRPLNPFIYYKDVVKDRKLKNYAYDLIWSYHNLRYIINATSHLKCPGRSLMPLMEQVNSSHSKITDAAFRIYEIILEEECNFPYPRTLSSALKLRDDKRVTDFREVLFEWANSLLAGNISIEKTMRKEISQANRGLKTLSTYKKVSRIMTFASLPIAVASAITGYPVGIALIPISQAIAIDSIRREREYSWLLFGK